MLLCEYRVDFHSTALILPTSLLILSAFFSERMRSLWGNDRTVIPLF